MYRFNDLGNSGSRFPNGVRSGLKISIIILFVTIIFLFICYGHGARWWGDRGFGGRRHGKLRRLFQQCGDAGDETPGGIQGRRRQLRGDFRPRFYFVVGDEFRVVALRKENPESRSNVRIIPAQPQEFPVDTAMRFRCLPGLLEDEGLRGRGMRRDKRCVRQPHADGWRGSMLHRRGECAPFRDSPRLPAS